MFEIFNIIHYIEKYFNIILKNIVTEIIMMSLITNYRPKFRRFAGGRRVTEPKTDVFSCRLASSLLASDSLVTEDEAITTFKASNFGSCIFLDNPVAVEWEPILEMRKEKFIGQASTSQAGSTAVTHCIYSLAVRISS